MIDLEKAIAGEIRKIIFLSKKMTISLSGSVPEWDLYKTVTISGEIKFPGTYTIKKGEKALFTYRAGRRIHRQCISEGRYIYT